MIELGPVEELADRPFTAIARGDHDLAVMNRMLTRLRRHVAEVDVSHGPRDDRFPDDGEHMIVLPNPSLLASTADLIAVGFFGQARADVDHGPIIDLEARLVRSMPGTPGLVAYHNVRSPAEGWGNLVLFAGDADKAAWGHDELHQDAIHRSARHYHSIRLHNGVVRDGLPGSAPVRLVRTKYLDFVGDEVWRAVRQVTEQDARRGSPGRTRSARRG